MIKLFYLIAASLIYSSLAQNCQTLYSNTFYINSSSLIDIFDSNMQFFQKPVVVQPRSKWTASIPNADWIWSTNSTISNSDTILNFQVEINLNILPTNAELKVAVNNKVNVFANSRNATLCATTSSSNTTTCDLIQFLVLGHNTFKFYAINTGGYGGLIFSIKLVSHLNS